jgi:hypothetical protein
MTLQTISIKKKVQTVNLGQIGRLTTFQGEGQTKKLQRSGELMDAATDEKNYLMVPEGFDSEDLFINPFAFPIYWHIHNVGGEAGTSGNVKIPARPYLGISEAAQEEIVALFDMWMGGEISLFSNPLTGQTQASIPRPGGGRTFSRAIGRGFTDT